MFESIMNFFKKLSKKEKKSKESSNTAKERLHLVLMQDRANVSADFLELMRQEIIEVIKKYIDIDEKAIDVKLTNKTNEDGTIGAPALYANIPIVTIKNEARKVEVNSKKESEINKETSKESNQESNCLVSETNKSEQKEKIESEDGENKLEEQETSEQKQEQKQLEKDNKKSLDTQESQENLCNPKKSQEEQTVNKEETIKEQKDGPKQEQTNKQEEANKQDVKANS